MHALQLLQVTAVQVEPNKSATITTGSGRRFMVDAAGVSELGSDAGQAGRRRLIQRRTDDGSGGTTVCVCCVYMYSYCSLDATYKSYYNTYCYGRNPSTYPAPPICAG